MEIEKEEPESSGIPGSAEASTPVDQSETSSQTCWQVELFEFVWPLFWEPLLLFVGRLLLGPTPSETPAPSWR